MKGYDSSVYEKMSVAVDLLVFTIEDNKLKILLIERSEDPFKNALALPGVFVGIDETLGDWHKIHIADGNTGWLQASDLTII